MGRQRQVAVTIVPAPADTMPSVVGDTPAPGDQVPYARADHVHKGNVNKQLLEVSSAGIFTWVFPEAYPVGMVPIVAALAQNTVGATQPYVVNQYGPASNTQAQFIVFKAAPQTLGGTLLAIAGAVVNVFGLVADNAIKINVLATRPPT